MRYNDEQSVMQDLGISSWRNLSKDKFMNFVAAMPDMTDEVRLKIIEQLHQFTQLCKEWLLFVNGNFERWAPEKLSTRNHLKIYGIYVGTVPDVKCAGPRRGPGAKLLGARCDSGSGPVRLPIRGPRATWTESAGSSPLRK